MSRANEAVKWLKTVYLKDHRVHSVFSDYDEQPIVVIVILDESVRLCIPESYDGIPIRIEEHFGGDTAHPAHFA